MRPAVLNVGTNLHMSSPDADRSYARLRRIAAPLALVLVMPWLYFNIVRNQAQADDLPGLVGPTGWPRALIVALGVLGLIWLIQRVLEARPAFVVPEITHEPGATARAVGGVVLCVAYVAVLDALGFAFATALLLGSWLMLGRYRQPMPWLLITLIGTVVFLYVFVRFAQMPLPRGAGILGDISIALYRILRIY